MERIFFLAFKKEKQLEYWKETDGLRTYVRAYSFTAASGVQGPKLREGDLQVPEGIYGVEYLNPGSKYHRSFKLNYPNTFDKMMALNDERDDPGGDIFIHGGAESKGCIAIGDDAIAEVYALAEAAGIENVTVIIFPEDARRSGKFGSNDRLPAWIGELYDELMEELEGFKK